MKRIILTVAMLLALGTRILGEGTVTETVHRFRWRRGPWSMTLDWQASTNGWASQTTGWVCGEIRRVVFNPDEGAQIPSPAYDITLKDPDGVDVLAAQGGNLVSNVTSCVVPGEMISDGTTSNVIPFSVNSVLSLLVTNAGSTNAGTVTLYLE